MRTYPYTSLEGSIGRGNKPNDWWGLGVIVHELLTGRHLFASPEGDGFLSETRVRAAFHEHSWSYDDVTDPRWRLLFDGLLAPAADRWSWTQVSAWFDGQSPAVAPRPVAADRRRPTRYHFAGQEHPDPASLAKAFRENFMLARDHVAGVKVTDLMSWLHSTPVGTDADEVLSSVRASYTTPGRALVELQLILDPTCEAVFRGRPLSQEGLLDAISHANNGDTEAADWIREVRGASVLSVVGRHTDNPELSRADELLDLWWKRLSELLDTATWRTTPMGPYADQARTPLEGILLKIVYRMTADTDRNPRSGSQPRSPSWVTRSRSRPRGQVSSRYFLMPLGISAVHVPGITSCAGHDHRKRAARRLRALTPSHPRAQL